MGLAMLISSLAIKLCTASWFEIDLTIGHMGISGSPSKYSWVIKRVAIDGPLMETWIWAGRQSLGPLRQGYGPGLTVRKL
ncbi:hypothetical protein D3C84_1050210 [compost metagenome]